MLAKYVARRFFASIVVVLGVTLITLVLMDRTRGTYVPGIDLNPALRPEDIARLRADLGLDRPFYLWYLTWIWGVVHGDFGRSMIDGSTVMSHILDRLPNTLELTGTAIIIGIIVSVPLGVIGALRRGSKTDHSLTVVSVAGFAVPQFWMGLMLILIFSVTSNSTAFPGCRPAVPSAPLQEATSSTESSTWPSPPPCCPSFTCRPGPGSSAPACWRSCRRTTSAPPAPRA